MLFKNAILHQRSLKRENKRHVESTEINGKTLLSYDRPKRTPTHVKQQGLWKSSNSRMPRLIIEFPDSLSAGRLSPLILFNIDKDLSDGVYKMPSCASYEVLLKK